MIIRLVCYDIRDDRCRSRIFDKLESFGFLSIQKSVFCGIHSPDQWNNCAASLKWILEKYGNPEEDKILAVVISKNCAKNVFSIGIKTDIHSLLREEKLTWI